MTIAYPDLRQTPLHCSVMSTQPYVGDHLPKMFFGIRCIGLPLPCHQDLFHNHAHGFWICSVDTCLIEIDVQGFPARAASLLAKPVTPAPEIAYLGGNFGEPSDQKSCPPDPKCGSKNEAGIWPQKWPLAKNRPYGALVILWLCFLASKVVLLGTFSAQNGLQI